MVDNSNIKIYYNGFHKYNGHNLGISQNLLSRAHNIWSLHLGYKKAHNKPSMKCNKPRVRPLPYQYSLRSIWSGESRIRSERFSFGPVGRVASYRRLFLYLHSPRDISLPLNTMPSPGSGFVPKALFSLFANRVLIWIATYVFYGSISDLYNVAI